MPAQLIAIDWGTTNLRAYLLSSPSHILDKKQSPKGISQLQSSDFPLVFNEMISPWRKEYPQIPVIMSGMVGSRNGWQETPYLPCPAKFTRLAEQLTQPKTTVDPKPFIVGGVSFNQPHWCDVMRGEETEIYGAYRGGEELFCIPGTHSKWALVQDNAIQEFRTYLSGELYQILSQHSLLKKLMRHTSMVSESAFIRGVLHAKNKSRF